MGQFEYQNNMLWMSVSSPNPYIENLSPNVILGGGVFEKWLCQKGWDLISGSGTLTKDSLPHPSLYEGTTRACNPEKGHSWPC